jgi:AbrB family looped-hinge helix DNA binding protein
LRFSHYLTRCDQEVAAVTVLKLRKSAQLTLPTEIREALKVGEGDYLEAELVEGGVMLRPVDIVRREEASERIRATVATVRPMPEQARKSQTQQEAEIQAAVDEVRSDYAAERRGS